MTSVVARPLALALLLAAELCAASVAFDTGALRVGGSFVGVVGRFAQPGLRLLFAMAVAVGFFGYPKWRTLAPVFRRELEAAPIRWRWLAVHGVLGAATIPVSTRLFWAHPGKDEMMWLLSALLVLALLAAIAAVHALLPLGLIAAAGRAVGAGWFAGGAALAVLIGSMAHALWAPSASVAFYVVRAMLRPFMPQVKSSLADLGIGSDAFYVRIAPSCSGYEGVAMVLLFSGGWIWYFRKEYRFPAALILPPLAALTMWLLNCVRLTTLVLIGHWGYPDVAMGGFHSQAGWIAFVLVAMGLCVLSTRSPLFSLAAAGGRGANHAIAERNLVAAYLMPFLAVLGVSMLTKAISGGFDWLYPLRVLAAAAVLWYFRRDYCGVAWRFGPVSLAAGAAVFALWVALDAGAVSGMHPALAAAPAAPRALWLLFRTIGAVVTVPVAEELAFRGFLMRRLEKADFESVSWRNFALLPVLMSSLAFGAMHGGRWIEGSAAGAVYAWVMARTGRLGDAIAAHATTNALLAAWVLAGGQWQYW
jgi:exosortase E/protease (VPEID-CTERM system)